MMLVETAHVDKASCGSCSDLQVPYGEESKSGVAAAKVPHGAGLLFAIQKPHLSHSLSGEQNRLHNLGEGLRKQRG